MGDEHLDTIPETNSDEFIKSSVKNLVPSPSESEDLSDSEFDVPVCDDFTTFSNLLIDADDDFSSSDDESFSDVDISKEIYSNPLFDEEIISIKIDPHHFNAESNLIESLLNHDSLIFSFRRLILFLMSSPVNSFLLIIPTVIMRKKFVLSRNCCTITHLLDNDSLMEEIDLSFTPDDSMPPDIEEDDYDCERDILILEELLSNDSILLPENESFHFDIPSSSHPPAKPLDNDSGTLTVKVMGDISEQRLKAFHLPSESPIMIYGGNTPILDNCPKCGNPVDGRYSQGCALLQKKFKEDLLTYCIKNGIFQDFQYTFEPSNDNTNVVNALQEPFVVKQDPGAHYGYNCSLKVLIIPDSEPFNNQTIDELPQTLPSFDPTYYTKDGNSFTYDSTSNPVDDYLNVFSLPLQPPIYSYEFCGNDAYYGHDCSLQVPFT
nr:hypothetical protein [Tanacetum cinerariifolium]